MFLTFLLYDSTPPFAAVFAPQAVRNTGSDYMHTTDITEWQLVQYLLQLDVTQVHGKPQTLNAKVAAARSFCHTWFTTRRHYL
jgi:hypothetical protein